MNTFFIFLMHYLMQINGTFQTVPRPIVCHRIKQFTDKSVEEELILYKKTYISS